MHKNTNIFNLIKDLLLGNYLQKFSYRIKIYSSGSEAYSN